MNVYIHSKVNKLYQKMWLAQKQDVHSYFSEHYNFSGFIQVIGLMFVVSGYVLSKLLE